VSLSRSIWNASLGSVPSFGEVLWTGPAHRDRALRELLAGLDVAIRGVANHPSRSPLFGLLVDQRAGVLAVVLVAGRDRDRGHDRHVDGDGRVQLVAGERPRGGLASMAHLRIVRREDLARAAGTAGPRDVLVVDLELLADDLAQQARRLAHALVRDQRIVAFDGLQCPGGVACDLDQQRRPRVSVFPITHGLDAGAGVVKASTRPSRRAARGSLALTASISLRTAAQTSVTVSWTAAAPSIGVESRICSTGPAINPSSPASSSERSNTSRSLPCSKSRARKWTKLVG